MCRDQGHGYLSTRSYLAPETFCPLEQFLGDLDVHEIDHLPVLVLDRAAAFARRRFHGVQYFSRPRDLRGGWRHHIMDDLDLGGMDRHLAFEAEYAGAPSRCAQALTVGNTREGAVNRYDAKRSTRISDARGGKMPEVVPVPFARAASIPVGQHDVVGGGCTHCALEAAEIKLIVSSAKH